MKIRTILVDDEPRAHVIIENYASRCGELNLMGKFLNAPSALDFIGDHEVDLILLDINMPVVDGFGLLTSIDHPPLVIFTTAYAEFALESYEVNAVDYLKKPIPYMRFLRALDKVKEKMSGVCKDQYCPTSITLRIDGGDLKLPFESIYYVQSFGNYVKVFTDTKTLISQITTKELEDNLPHQRFLRIHKSFIVNRSMIQTASDSFVTVAGKQLPIGKTFKVYFRNSISNQ